MIIYNSRLREAKDNIDAALELLERQIKGEVEVTNAVVAASNLTVAKVLLLCTDALCHTLEKIR